VLEAISQFHAANPQHQCLHLAATRRVKHQQATNGVGEYYSRPLIARHTQNIPKTKCRTIGVWCELKLLLYQPRYLMYAAKVMDATRNLQHKLWLCKDGYSAPNGWMYVPSLH